MAAYRACAACDGFGFVPHTAAPAFDVFYWLQVTNFQVTNFGLLKSAPNRADYSHIRRSVLHCQLFVGTFALGCSTDTLLASVLIVYPLFEVACVLMRLNHVACIIVNANNSAM